MLIIFLINIYFFLSLYIDKFQKPEIEPFSEGGGFLTKPSPFFKHPLEAKNFLTLPKVYYLKPTAGKYKGRTVRWGPSPTDTPQVYMDRCNWKKTKRLTQYKKYKLYPWRVKDISNKELKKYYLSKKDLTLKERYELYTLIQARRGICDSLEHPTIHFNKAQYNVYSVYKEYADIKYIQHKKWERLEALKYKIKCFKDSRYSSSMFEDWKETVGYFTQYDMVRKGDFHSIYLDMMESIYYEKQGSWTKDRLHGYLAFRTKPPQINIRYRKPRQDELRRLISVFKQMHYEKIKVSRDPIWLYHDPYSRKNHFEHSPPNMLNEYNRFTYYGRIKFRQQVPAQLKLLVRYTKIRRHSRRIKDSWEFLLNPKVPLVTKINRLINGFDLQLDWTGKTDRLLYYWFGVKRQLKTEEDLKRYLDHLDVWNYDPKELKDINHIRHLHGDNLKWHFEHWAHPNWWGNSIFIENYFKPWLIWWKKHPGVTKKNRYGHTATDWNIFWFKYSHKDYILLKHVKRHQSFDACKFQSGPFYRFIQEFVYFYRRKVLSYPENEQYKQFFFRKKWSKWCIPNRAQRKKIDPQYYHKKYGIAEYAAKCLYLPRKFVPTIAWKRYYIYTGPNFWWRDLITQPKNIRFITTSSPEFLGPMHLPTAVSYSTYFEDFSCAEFKVILWWLGIPGLDSEYLFYLSPIFVYLIFIVSLLTYIIFYFFQSYAPTVDKEWWFATGHANMVTRKVFEKNYFLTQIEGWTYNKFPNRLRHDFNWFFCLLFFPLLYLMFILPFFFENAMFLYFENFEHWIIGLGSFSFWHWVRIYYLVKKKQREEFIKSEKFQKYRYKHVLKEKVKLKAAQDNYDRLFAEACKEAGLSYDPDHLKLPKYTDIK